MENKVKVFNQSSGEWIEVEPITYVINVTTGRVVEVTPTIHHVPAVVDAAEKEAQENE